MYPYGLICSVFVSLLGGFGARLAPDIGPKTIDYYYGKDSQVICGSPAFLEVSRRHLSDNIRFPGLRTFISGGDFLSVEQSHTALNFFHQHGALNVMMANGSGNGEILGCCTNSMGAPYRPETVGKLILGPKYRVVNSDTEEETKYDEPGELWVAGKHVFKEYYGQPKRTAEVKVKYRGRTYYKTGNYGSLDRDRYFTLIGRASRFYITNTFNKVYCEHVQQALCAFLCVESCAVVPIPDPETLYKSKAYVVLRGDQPPTEETKQYLIRYLQDPPPYARVTLADYEIPTNITFVDSLPRTAADKIDYEFLKQKAEEEARLTPI